MRVPLTPRPTRIAAGLHCALGPGVMQGYTVFVVDEPCFAGRDSKGELQPNSTTWPHGFKAFGEFLSERGMELGIYTDAGPRTCQGCPASAGHEAQDMATFIGWGASYIKVDRCFGVDGVEMREDLPSTFAKYREAADTLSPSKRVQISAILAATDNCWEWCNGTCDHCRTTGDIRNSFVAMENHVDQQESIPYIETFAGVSDQRVLCHYPLLSLALPVLAFFRPASVTVRPYPNPLSGCIRFFESSSRNSLATLMTWT